MNLTASEILSGAKSIDKLYLQCKFNLTRIEIEFSVSEVKNYIVIVVAWRLWLINCSITNIHSDIKLICYETNSLFDPSRIIEI